MTKRLAALRLTEVQPGLLSSQKKPTEVLAALRKAGHAPVGAGGSEPQVARAEVTSHRAGRPGWVQTAEMVAALRGAADQVPLELVPPAAAGRFGHLTDD